MGGPHRLLLKRQPTTNHNRTSATCWNFHLEMRIRLTAYWFCFRIFYNIIDIVAWVPTFAFPQLHSISIPPSKRGWSYIFGPESAAHVCFGPGFFRPWHQTVLPWAWRLAYTPLTLLLRTSMARDPVENPHGIRKLFFPHQDHGTVKQGQGEDLIQFFGFA